MTTFRVERMPENDWCKYMSGSNDYYNVETLYIDAETAEIAILKAQRSGYRVNESVQPLAKNDNKITTFKVEIMPKDDWHDFMSGGMKYHHIETLYVDAKTAEVAILKARRPGYEIYGCEPLE